MKDPQEDPTFRKTFDRQVARGVMEIPTKFRAIGNRFGEIRDTQRFYVEFNEPLNHKEEAAKFAKERAALEAQHQVDLGRMAENNALERRALDDFV